MLAKCEYVVCTSEAVPTPTVAHHHVTLSGWCSSKLWTCSLLQAKQAQPQIIFGPFIAYVMRRRVLIPTSSSLPSATQLLTWAACSPAGVRSSSHARTRCACQQSCTLRLPLSLCSFHKNITFILGYYYAQAGDDDEQQDQDTELAQRVFKTIFQMPAIQQMLKSAVEEI